MLTGMSDNQGQDLNIPPIPPPPSPPPVPSPARPAESQPAEPPPANPPPPFSEEELAEVSGRIYGIPPSIQRQLLDRSRDKVANDKAWGAKLKRLIAEQGIKRMELVKDLGSTAHLIRWATEMGTTDRATYNALCKRFPKLVLLKTPTLVKTRRNTTRIREKHKPLFPENVAWGKKLTDVIKSSPYKQDQLADRWGITRTHLSNAKNGQCLMPADMVRQSLQTFPEMLNEPLPSYIEGNLSLRKIVQQKPEATKQYQFHSYDIEDYILLLQEHCRKLDDSIVSFSIYPDGDHWATHVCTEKSCSNNGLDDTFLKAHKPSIKEALDTTVLIIQTLVQQNRTRMEDQLAQLKQEEILAEQAAKRARQEAARLERQLQLLHRRDQSSTDQEPKLLQLIRPPAVEAEPQMTDCSEPPDDST
jgi:hypothetical protein